MEILLLSLLLISLYINYLSYKDKDKHVKGFLDSSQEKDDKIQQLERMVGGLEQQAEVWRQDFSDLQSKKEIMEYELKKEQEKNITLLSQKKSSETRLGQISEHLIPFLEGCKHEPKNMHFIGNPIDYLVFNFDEGEIIFLEVKSGNSQPNKRQKIIKNLIKNGRVYYEELRINEKGVKNRRIDNEN